MSTDTAPVPSADQSPATAHLMRQFRSDHLPPSLREVSERCQHVAQLMLRDFPDGPELTAGLRKLLEAKDCFVRHAVDTAAEPEHQKCICGHGMVSHGGADWSCTMCVVNGVLGCQTFRTGEDTTR